MQSILKENVPRMLSTNSTTSLDTHLTQTSVNEFGKSINNPVHQWQRAKLDDNRILRFGQDQLNIVSRNTSFADESERSSVAFDEERCSDFSYAEDPTVLIHDIQ